MICAIDISLISSLPSLLFCNRNMATTCVRITTDSRDQNVSISNHYVVFYVDGALLKDHKIMKTRSMKHSGENAFVADVSNIWGEAALCETDML